MCVLMTEKDRTPSSLEMVMRRSIRLVAAVAALLFVLPDHALALSTSKCDTAASVNARFIVRYERNRLWHAVAPDQKKISDRDRVEVCIQHFNFLRYTLKFDISETRSESYGYLATLWASIASPDLAGILATGQEQPAEDELLARLQALYRTALETDRAVADATRPYLATGLTDTEVDRLLLARGDESASPPMMTGVVAKLNRLRAASSELEALILSPAAVSSFGAIFAERKEIYEKVTTFAAAASARAEVFLALSAKTIGIEVKKIGKRQPGTRVTFTIVAVDGSGSTTPVEDVSYFVQTNMPLVAHGGMAFSTLKDVSFDKVKRAGTFGEADFFQQRTDENNSRTLTAFLGWQFLGLNGDATDDGRKSRYGAALSLGTDVRQPGKRVFIGPSLFFFNRLVVTAGPVLGKEARGEDDTLEPNVFRIVRERPTTKWFFSVSTKVY